MNNPMPSGQERPRLIVVNGEAAILDGEWASDHWDAARLGIPARRGRGTARFDGIGQQWLRDPVKRWSRLRLATGCAFATIDAGALALTRFSGFLATRHPEAGDESAITRPALEDYLSWLLTQGYSASTRALSLSMIRVFFDACHRHGWLPGLAASATIYVEELPFHHDEIARFIPEFVMAQLESGEAIAKIPHTTTRNLVVVMIETGLRGGDACNLPFNPVLTDSSGWPCLRFEAVKVRAEQMIPLSAKAAAAIGAQQDHVRERWPAGSPWLFPGIAGNDDGLQPYSHSTFTRQLAHWQRVIGLRDQASQPVTVTGHQFRHTLGTRLINSGVPQHVVQKLLGHASPGMTSHYAKIHDATIREAFDHYQSTRVNIAGEPIGYNPDAPAASAEWVKHNLNRVRDSLPNGYCGRPAQQDCPHPNACVRCPLLRVDPAQVPRLEEIHANLGDRLQEAKEQGWLGEVAAIEATLAAAAQKLQAMRDLTTRSASTSIHIGMPDVRPSAGRHSPGS
jgi:integrase